MNKETLKVPKLTQPVNYNYVIPKKKNNMNLIILLCFVLFLIFFLMSGIFKNNFSDPVPFNLYKN
uniref:Uncharacterized protein n=1 Tax=viral metagenome TaxID=1070528 RepID=A0A6C0I8G4_9ZZZZ